MRWIGIFLWCIATISFAEEKKICLNMIVKDESPVIERCLATVKPLIDYWVIVDTGSTDGTQKIITEFLSDIPGELHESSWVNFEHNRNEAMELAKGKGDYYLLVDADEVLDGTFDKECLSADAYLIEVKLSSSPLITIQRAFLLADQVAWRWKGVVHEQLKCDKVYSIDSLQGITLSAEARDGHRSTDPEKYLKDAQVLEKALLDEPDNSEYVYYLAQSYHSAQKFEEALRNYKKMANMENGWAEYRFWSMYQIAGIEEMLGKSPEVFIKSYSRAFQYRPTRGEPICRLAHYYYTTKNYLMGYILAQYGANLPVPADRIYVEHWVYSYGFLAILANCAFEMGWHKEAISLYDQLLQKEDTPLFMKQEARNTILYIRDQHQL